MHRDVALQVSWKTSTPTQARRTMTHVCVKRFAHSHTISLNGQNSIIEHGHMSDAMQQAFCFCSAVYSDLQLAEQSKEQQLKTA